MGVTDKMAFGVHSEVGQLHKVMVCSPGIAHQRLTPSNCDDLLFDDVLWVENAKRDHFDFVQKMRDRGIDVVEMHNLLTETVAIPEAKQWILDNQVVPNQVGLGLVDEIRSYLESVRRIYDVWLSLTIRCNMMRIIARMTKAACDRLRFSKSFANLRQRPNQPNVRSTIQRLGKTVKPFAVSERLTISSGILASARTATAVAAP